MHLPLHLHLRLRLSLFFSFLFLLSFSSLLSFSFSLSFSLSLSLLFLFSFCLLSLPRFETQEGTFCAASGEHSLILQAHTIRAQLENCAELIQLRALVGRIGHLRDADQRGPCFGHSSKQLRCAQLIFIVDRSVKTNLPHDGQGHDGTMDV